MTTHDSPDLVSTIREAAIPDLIPIVEQVTRHVSSHCAQLSPAQLTWQPAPDRWSVALCLDHLITTFDSYRPVFARLQDGPQKPRLLERVPIMPRLFGRLLISALSPGNRAESPGAFRPELAAAIDSLLPRFAAVQEELTTMMARCHRDGLGGIIITSPASRWVVYSLRDAFRVLTIHELGHVAQLDALIADSEFPT